MPEKSKCCNAPVEVEVGRGGSKGKVTTNFYVCMVCGKPCDLQPSEEYLDDDYPEAFDPDDNRYKWPEDRR